MDRVPQLILAGQTNSTLLGTKAFQETNITDMVSDVSVYNHQIQKGDNVFEIVKSYSYKHMKNVVCSSSCMS